VSSWIDIPAGSDFSLHNLPYGVFRRDGRAAVGAAVGDRVLDLSRLHEAGLFAGTPAAAANVFARDALNDFMALGPAAWSAVRRRVRALASGDDPALRDNAVLREAAVVPRSSVEMLLPCRIGDYTDFYSSLEHATNMGMMFRDPKNALLPNWKHIPVGYNGRAGSVVVSGTPIRRPLGQTKADDAGSPAFGPSRLLDVELEMGFFTGTATTLGEPVPIGDAERHIFGLVLVNDWSARDIQKWEYVPLGPFLGKSFGTSVSPWVVPLEALEPFRVAGPVQDPEPLPYLRFSRPAGFDIHLEIALRGPGTAEAVVSRTNFKHMYWNMAQQLAHQTSNGTNIRPGDLYASGTISGPTEGSYGSLLELTWRGTKPIAMPDGTQRRFLQDGDTVTMRGWAQGDGYRVGFGEVSGMILPARG